MKYYTKEFKREAIKLIKEHGYSEYEAAQRLGINSKNIYRWLKEVDESEKPRIKKNALTEDQLELLRLRKENERLKMEKEILKRQRPSLRTKKLRYEFISEQEKDYPVIILCETMQVHRSGYYKYLKTKASGKPKNNLLMEIKNLFKESKGSYGSRRIAKGLQEKGYKIGRYRARTMMKNEHLICKQRRKFRLTTQSNHSRPIAENRLNQAFKVMHPNRVWTADITYLCTQEGWLYLSVVLDLFSRRVVGWSIAERMEEKLVRDALLMALGRRNPPTGLMHHSDRGSQYASKNYQKLLKKRGIVVSMNRKGNCWDNAVMERFFGSLKSERLNNVVYKTREEARKDIVDYIEMFYNSKRLHSTLGYKTPMQYEENYVTQVSTFT